MDTTPTDDEIHDLKTFIDNLQDFLQTSAKSGVVNAWLVKERANTQEEPEDVDPNPLNERARD